MSTDYNHARAVYEIRVEGELDQGWENWLNGLAVRLSYGCQHPPTTTLVGPVTDQAALRGLLCRLWDLNLTLVSVRRIDEKEKEVHGTD